MFGSRFGRRFPAGRGPRVVLVAAALSLATVACQSTDTTETGGAVADLPTEETAATGAGSTEGSADAGSDNDDPPTEAEIEEAQLAFDQCMADAGFDLGGGAGGGEAIEDSDGDNREGQSLAIEGDGEELDAAFEKCDELLEGVFGSYEPSPEEEAELADQQAAFANCLSEFGIEIDSEGGDGGFAIGFESESDEDFEEQEQAMNDCAEKAFGESLIGPAESSGPEDEG